MKCLTFRLAGRIKKSKQAIITKEIIGKGRKDASPPGYAPRRDKVPVP
jgi:hypothetical protein